MVSDDRLIEAVMNGDDNAYRELIIRYKQLIFAAVFKIVNNYQDAEDLAQDVFIEAYKSLKNFRGDARLSTWLIKIATNKALDFRRKQKKQASCLISDDIFDTGYIEKEYHSDHRSQPELAYISKENSLEIQRHLMNVPDIYRQVLQQSYIDGLSCREIAEKEGVPVKTIASRLYRGKKILRSQGSSKSKGEKVQ